MTPEEIDARIAQITAQMEELRQELQRLRAARPAVVEPMPMSSTGTLASFRAVRPEDGSPLDEPLTRRRAPKKD